MGRHGQPSVEAPESKYSIYRVIVLLQPTLEIIPVMLVLGAYTYPYSIQPTLEIIPVMLVLGS